MSDNLVLIEKHFVPVVVDPPWAEYERRNPQLWEVSERWKQAPRSRQLVWIVDGDKGRRSSFHYSNYGKPEALSVWLHNVAIADGRVEKAAEQEVHGAVIQEVYGALHQLYSWRGKGAPDAAFRKRLVGFQKVAAKLTGADLCHPEEIAALRKNLVANDSKHRRALRRIANLSFRRWREEAGDDFPDWAADLQRWHRDRVFDHVFYLEPLVRLLGKVVPPEKEGKKQASASKVQVDRHLDEVYVPKNAPDHHRKHRLDLYTPKGVADAPLLVFIHGGGWTGGDRTHYRRLGAQLASYGVAVALPSYRLSPAVKHPAHANDCARAVAWLVENAARFGYDASRIVLGGHSAGGHLSAFLALERDTLTRHGVAADLIAGVVPVSGPFDVRAPHPAFFNAFGRSLDDRDDASPIRLVHDEAPPFLVLWARSDFLTLPEIGRGMVKALKRHDVDVEGHELDNRDHLTIVTRMLEDGDLGADHVLRFVERVAGPKSDDE